MSWNGESLVSECLRKYGFRDSAARARVLGWLNDIQKDISASHKWPFLRFKMKKCIASDSQEISIAPQIPSAPIVAISTGGSLTDTSTYRVKVTFLIFDESGREVDSLESEPSTESSLVTASGTDLTVTITSIDTYDGVTTVKPNTIHRRIYLSKDSGDFYLAKTIEDNTTTTTTIASDTSSTVQPPDYAMVFCLSGDPIIEGSGNFLNENALDDILKYDPGLTSTGTPYYYARVTDEKIMLYPRPSVGFTLSYWVYRIPSRIFNDSTRPIQLHASLKEVLMAGVTWKGYEDKDQDGQESKKNNYERLVAESKGILGRTGGTALTVKRIC